MPNLEDIRRKAQNAAYIASEKAQDAAVAAGEKAEELMASAGGKAEELKNYAGGKAGSFMASAGEKAGALWEAAGEKAGALKEAARANLALMSEKRSLEKNYQALGEWYAAQCGEDAPEAAADIVRAIRASQAKITELRERGAAEPKDGEDAAPETEIPESAAEENTAK